MAWIFFQELEDSRSPSNLGCEPWHIARTTASRRVFSCPECGQVSLREPQSGPTCVHCAENIFSRQSTSFSGASHARTSAVQALAQAWKASEAVCFSKSSDWSMNYDHDSHSWKTSQLSLLADLEPLSPNLPASGMTVAGRLYQPRRLEPLISDEDGSCSPVIFPCVTSYEDRTSPEVFRERQKRNPKVGMSLGVFVKIWPTPMARDYKGRGGANRNSMDLPKAVGGSLNPTWVEWLMGFRIGWTELDVSAMQWFLCKREKRSKD